VGTTKALSNRVYGFRARHRVGLALTSKDTADDVRSPRGRIDHPSWWRAGLSRSTLLVRLGGELMADDGARKAAPD
jgi:hypothetical protein